MFQIIYNFQLYIEEGLKSFKREVGEKPSREVGKRARVAAYKPKKSMLSLNFCKLYTLQVGTMETKLWTNPSVQDKVHIISNYSNIVMFTSKNSYILWTVSTCTTSLHSKFS